MSTFEVGLAISKLPIYCIDIIEYYKYPPIYLLIQLQTNVHTTLDHRFTP